MKNQDEMYDQLLIENAQLKVRNAELENYRIRSEQVGDALFISDLDGNILFVNNHTCKSLCYTKEELLLKKMSDIDNTYVSLESQKNFWNDLVPGQQHFLETTHIRKDKQVFPVELSVGITEMEGKKVIVSFARDITMRKLAESDLRLSERKFVKLFQTSPNVLVISSLEDGRIIDVNDMGISALGYTRDEIIGKTRKELKLVEPEDFKILLDLLKKDGYYSDVELKVRLKDGSYTFGLFNGQLIEIDGESVHFQTIVDLTSVKLTELELRQSEERFRRLFEGLGDAVYVTKIGGEDRGLILEANPAAVKQSGFSRKELLKMNIINDLRVPELGDIETDDWEAKLESEAIVYLTEKKKNRNGDEYWTEVIVTCIEYNGEKASLSINHDISERKNAEISLVQSETKFRNLYENTPAILHSINLKGELISVSNKWLDVMGYKIDEVIGVKSYEFLTRESRRYATEVVLPDYYKNGYCFDVPYQFVSKKGEIIDMLLSAISEKDDDGKVVRSLAVLEDITKRKKDEEELRIYREHLEDLVNERTTELELKNQELERMNSLFVGREFRIKELRDKLKQMEKNDSD